MMLIYFANGTRSLRLFGNARVNADFLLARIDPRSSALFRVAQRRVPF